MKLLIFNLSRAGNVTSEVAFPFNPFPVLTHWPVDSNVFLSSEPQISVSNPQRSRGFFWRKKNKQKAQELLLKGNHVALDLLQIKILG